MLTVSVIHSLCKILWISGDRAFFNIMEMSKLNQIERIVLCEKYPIYL